MTKTRKINPRQATRATATRRVKNAGMPTVQKKLSWGYRFEHKGTKRRQNPSTPWPESNTERTRAEHTKETGLILALCSTPVCHKVHFSACCLLQVFPSQARRKNMPVFVWTSPVIVTLRTLMSTTTTTKKARPAMVVAQQAKKKPRNAAERCAKSGGQQQYTSSAKAKVGVSRSLVFFARRRFIPSVTPYKKTNATTPPPPHRKASSQVGKAPRRVCCRLHSPCPPIPRTRGH